MRLGPGPLSSRGALLLLGLAATVARAVRGRDPVPVLWLLGALAVVGVIALQHRAPPQRVVLPLLPWWIAFGCAGFFAAAGRICDARWRAASLGSAAAVLAVGSAWSARGIWCRDALASEDPDTVTEAREAVAFLAARGAFDGKSVFVPDLQSGSAFFHSALVSGHSTVPPETPERMIFLMIPARKGVPGRVWERGEQVWRRPEMVAAFPTVRVFWMERRSPE